MIAFIDEHRSAYGVEPICRVLQIALSTYHEHAARRVNPSRLPPRAKRDAELCAAIQRLHDTNFGVYRGASSTCWTTGAMRPAARP